MFFWKHIATFLKRRYMFLQNFCHFPTQNFTEWESSHHFVLFFLSPFPTRFFIPFSFLSLFFFLRQTSLPTSIFSPPPPAPLLLLYIQPLPAIVAALATASHCHPCHCRPTNLQALPSLATTHCQHHTFFPLFWCSSFFKM